MSTPHPADAASDAVRDPLLLTWTFTETYRRRVPVQAVAAATGHQPTDLVVDPAMLLGAAGDRLADLLSDLHDPDCTVGVPEVEIIGADHDRSPNLTELVDAANTALRHESVAGQRSATGQALAALLAWLHREEHPVG